MCLSIFQLDFIVLWRNEPQSHIYTNKIKLRTQQFIQTQSNNKVLLHLQLLLNFNEQLDRKLKRFQIKAGFEC